KKDDWLKHKLSEEDIKRYQANGYINHVQVLTHEQCDLLLQEYRCFMENDMCQEKMDLLYEYHRNQTGDENNVLMHALGHWRVSPLFHDLVFLPSVVVSMKCNPLTLLIFKVHIALEDQTEDNGTIQYIPGSHRWNRNGEPLPVLDFNFKDMEIIKVHGKRFVYKFVCDLKMLLGYTAAELGRLVGTAEEISVVERRTPQAHHIRGRNSHTYIATIKSDAHAAARLIEQQAASSRIIEQRTQVVQTVD
uniref:Uncharacterized protein n=1 Tax=Biomphalaria glabrata TaxID=6526 RepID=A0A2C9JT98_BIOGL